MKTDYLIHLNITNFLLDRFQQDVFVYFWQYLDLICIVTAFKWFVRVTRLQWAEGSCDNIIDSLNFAKSSDSLVAIESESENR